MDDEPTPLEAETPEDGDSATETTLIDRPEDPKVATLPKKADRAAAQIQQRNLYLRDMSDQALAWDRLSDLEAVAFAAYNATEPHTDEREAAADEVNALRSQMIPVRDAIDGLGRLVASAERIARRLDPSVSLERPKLQAGGPLA